MDIQFSFFLSFLPCFLRGQEALWERLVSCDGTFRSAFASIPQRQQQRRLWRASSSRPGLRVFFLSIVVLLFVYSISHARATTAVFLHSFPAVT